MKISGYKIAHELYELVFHYKRDVGSEPESLLVGPQEYLALCSHLDEDELDELYGIPVRIKKGPGVDLEIPEHDFHRFLHT